MSMPFCTDLLDMQQRAPCPVTITVQKARWPAPPAKMWHLSYAVRLQPSHHTLNYIQKVKCCWPDGCESSPTKCTGCLPASTPSRRRQSCNNGATRRCTSFCWDTDKSQFQHVWSLPSNPNAQQQQKKVCQTEVINVTPTQQLLVTR